MRSLSLYFLTDVIVLAMAIAARAGEGGSSHYAPGSFASFVDVLPGEPSLAAFNYFTYYNGSAGVSRELEIAGLIAANVSAITAAARMAQEMYPKNHGRSDWSSEAPARSISTT